VRSTRFRHSARFVFGRRLLWRPGATRRWLLPDLQAAGKALAGLRPTEKPVLTFVRDNQRCDRRGSASAASPIPRDPARTPAPTLTRRMCRECAHMSLGVQQVVARRQGGLSCRFRQDYGSAAHFRAGLLEDFPFSRRARLPLARETDFEGQFANRRAADSPCPLHSSSYRTYDERGQWFGHRLRMNLQGDHRRFRMIAAKPDHGGKHSPTIRDTAVTGDVESGKLRGWGGGTDRLAREGRRDFRARVRRSDQGAFAHRCLIRRPPLS
jgi:hypothetical protein